MIYKNYSIWIQKNATKQNLDEGDWEGFIWEGFYPHYYRYWDSWAVCIDESSPKKVYELAKKKIDEYENNQN